MGSGRHNNHGKKLYFDCHCTVLISWSSRSGNPRLVAFVVCLLEKIHGVLKRRKDEEFEYLIAPLCTSAEKSTVWLRTCHIFITVKAGASQNWCRGIITTHGWNFKISLPLGGELKHYRHFVF